MNNTKVIILFLILFFSFFCFVNDSTAANYPLEIINIEEVGENNRIRFAYPGIEYKVVVAAIGGTYPFVWELAAAPSGMTIDSKTGIIAWDNPAIVGSPHAVTVKVTDKEGGTDIESYEITVTDSTNRFIWLDASTTEDIGSRNGSISHPYKNLSDFWQEGGHGRKICYMRTGTYDFSNIEGINARGHGSYRVSVSEINHPIAWIGYPGESVYFSGTRGWNGENTGKHWSMGGADRYYQNVSFRELYGYAFELTLPNDYMTVFDCVFDDLVPYAGYQNDAFISYGAVGSHDKNLIAHNEFKNAAAPYGTGIKTYTTAQMLLEANAFYNCNDMGISWKSSTAYSVARNNTFDSCNRAIGIGGYETCDNNEISHNFFRNSTGSALYMNDSGTTSNTYIYRNTLADYMHFRLIEIDDSPFTVYNNVITNNFSDTGFSQDFYRNKSKFQYLTAGSEELIFNTNFTFTNNLLGTANDGVIDSDGLLINRTYVGTYGWEIAEDEYWDGEGDEIAPSTPSGLAIS